MRILRRSSTRFHNLDPYHDGGADVPDQRLLDRTVTGEEPKSRQNIEGKDPSISVGDAVKDSDKNAMDGNVGIRLPEENDPVTVDLTPRDGVSSGIGNVSNGSSETIPLTLLLPIILGSTVFVAIAMFLLYRKRQRQNNAKGTVGEPGPMTVMAPTAQMRSDASSIIQHWSLEAAEEQGEAAMANIEKHRGTPYPNDDQDLTSSGDDQVWLEEHSDVFLPEEETYGDIVTQLEGLDSTFAHEVATEVGKRGTKGGHLK